MRPDRIKARAALTPHGATWPTWATKISGGQAPYLEALSSHMFAMAPHGNGLDTHRMYEIMLLGCIPVRYMYMYINFQTKRCMYFAVVFCWV